MSKIDSEGSLLPHGLVVPTDWLCEQNNISLLFVKISGGCSAKVELQITPRARKFNSHARKFNSHARKFNSHARNSTAF